MSFAPEAPRRPSPAPARVGGRRSIGAGARANVLLVIERLGIGGAEVVIRDLARHVDRDRFNVAVCCLKELGPTGRVLASEGIDVSVLPNADPARVDYFTARHLWHVLRTKRIDLIHTHTTHALVDAAACRCLSRAVKVVHTFHFGNYPHHSPRTRMMEAVSSRLVDRLVAVGEVQRKVIRETYRLPESAIRTVRNGVHIPASNGGDPDFRRRIGAEGKVLVGTIAHLCPQKGLYDLLAVAQRVRELGLPVHFVVVGNGDLRADLERRQRELSLTDTVTFAGLVDEAATRVLPVFDIYFHPSLWEAMSVSVLEAMAAGKGIVTTDVGETPLVIDDGVEGLLCRPGDVAAMTAAVLRLVRDPFTRLALGAAARRRTSQGLTLGHMTRAYEQLYCETLRSSTSAHASH